MQNSRGGGGEEGGGVREGGDGRSELISLTLRAFPGLILQLRQLRDDEGVGWTTKGGRAKKLVENTSYVKISLK